MKNIIDLKKCYSVRLSLIRETDWNWIVVNRAVTGLLVTASFTTAECCSTGQLVGWVVFACLFTYDSDHSFVYTYIPKLVV